MRYGFMLLLFTLFAPATAMADCGSDAYIGSICTTATRFCPQATLPANGQLLEVSKYKQLFAAIGNLYGGNGRTTFKTPNLNLHLRDNRRKIPPQMLRCIVIQGTFPPKP